MLQSKAKLEQYIIECSKKQVNNKELQRKFETLKDKYNIPYSISSDILTLRKHPMEFSEFVLFCILETLDEKQLQKYFNNTEIEGYHKQKYHKTQIKFPFVLSNMVDINSDQWIGKITVKQLMQLKEAQLINYDENSQRTMQHIVDGNKEYYQITINKRAVNKIRESFEIGSYIPNTITLNVPPAENGENEFMYQNGNLIFNKLSHFNITDGYHRYVAMAQIYDLDNSFDYNMELRVTAFDESRAQQFIFQEDQKTQMKKIVSDSFNQFEPSNKVVMRLNSDPLCDLQGMINRNSAIVDFSELSVLINSLFFKEIPKDNRNLEVNNIKNILRDKFNIVYSNMPELFIKKITTKELLILVYIFKTNISTKEMLRAITFCLEHQAEIDNKVINEKRIRVKVLNQLEAILRTGGFNV
jgi:hypothetical protein